ncbi:MAG: hypothetical protein GY713_18480 [Actinomycetia bacterium]|nr:hypothetical protein [Actinomycetes bacterium]
MRRLSALALLVALLSGSLLSWSAASAQTDGGTFTFEVAGVLTGQTPGSVAELHTEAVPADLVGQTCTFAVATENNSSVHPGNALVLQTGDASGEIPEVEATPGQTFNGSAPVVLGETIVASIRFGDNGITSGGFTITITCAPVGGVETGAGGTASSGGPLVPKSLAVIALAVGIVGLVAANRRFNT